MLVTISNLFGGTLSNSSDSKLLANGGILVPIDLALITPIHHVPLFPEGPSYLSKLAPGSRRSKSFIYDILHKIPKGRPL